VSYSTYDGSARELDPTDPDGDALFPSSTVARYQECSYKTYRSTTRESSVLFREPVLGLPDTRIFGGLLVVPLPEYSACPIRSTCVRGYVR